MIYELIQYNFGSETRSHGDFEHRRAFAVMPATKGIIIQHVTRKTYVRCENIKYTTDAQIYNFTNNMVQHSNVAYYEYFIVNADGQSECADSFASGAITRYMDNIPDLELATSGKINFDATAFFISQFNPLFTDIINLPWHTNADFASNGAPYLTPDDKAAYAAIAKYKNIAVDSNIITHNVIVKWNNTNTTIEHSDLCDAPDTYTIILNPLWLSSIVVCVICAYFGILSL
jgi:hypothetical protein